MGADEKTINAARKRYDTVLLNGMREFNGPVLCYKNDGFLWVSNGSMAMCYYETDYLLSRDKLDESPRLKEVIDATGRYGVTIPAEITKYLTLGMSLYAVFSDGIHELQVNEKLYKVFGPKFIYCIHNGVLAVFNGNDLCGVILPVKFKEED